MVDLQQPGTLLASQFKKKTIKVAGRLLDFSTPVVMGIINLTPDSFYEGSRFEANQDKLLQAAGQMIADGAKILDVGGYSTRPGAAEVSELEESDRVLGAIEALSQSFPSLIISVDTFRAEVARKAVMAGASIINDVSGGNLDEGMFGVVAESGVPYVLMHMRGTPQTMVKQNRYNNLIRDVVQEIAAKLDKLNSLGVADVIVDPGFGFAKNVPQNFELLNNLEYFQNLDAALLIGLSRKSMIWRSLETTADESLNGTTALNMTALQKGANILRVHDVKEAVETIKLWKLTTLRN
ncbi:dihydropteroate synthase [Persicitalea jodogahamensis]|uniref:dihydropteroate synthase n=1 Tax=Persicitalea jodogahamensis TaxID=402147 RepID=A0A8J3GBA5_9BACT|nr:dihydropteroate synthase [Persicitalea jodogahamensis]GHB80444.1 dihydropteroate synthase [Persicitalea jodogahamensis]